MTDVLETLNFSRIIQQNLFLSQLGIRNLPYGCSIMLYLEPF